MFIYVHRFALTLLVAGVRASNIRRFCAICAVQVKNHKHESRCVSKLSKKAMRACFFKYVYIDKKYIIYSTMTRDYQPTYFIEYFIWEVLNLL